MIEIFNDQKLLRCGLLVVDAGSGYSKGSTTRTAQALTHHNEQQPNTKPDYASWWMSALGKGV